MNGHPFMNFWCHRYETWGHEGELWAPLCLSLNECSAHDSVNHVCSAVALSEILDTHAKTFQPTYCNLKWCDDNSRTLHGYETVKQRDKPTKTKRKFCTK